MGVSLGNRSAIRCRQSGSRRSRAIQHAVDSSSIVAAGDDMCRRRIAVAGTHWKERTWTNMVAVFVGLGLVIGANWLPGHGNGPEEQTAGEKKPPQKSMHSCPRMKPFMQ